MKQNAYVIGAGMTRFGKHLDFSLKSLAADAITGALTDAGISSKSLQAAYMGNAAAGIITGQVCVPGQTVLRSIGIGKIPVVNIENACATAATAFQQACTMITSGVYDVVLACGYEKLYHTDKLKTFSVFTGAVDVEDMDNVTAGIQKKFKAVGAPLEEGAGSTRSLFVDIYATWALEHMQRYGTTREQFAAVSAKNSIHGNLNPNAQYQEVISVEDVLNAREVAWPLTVPMCSPLGDGAAAVVLVSEKKARELGMSRAVKVEASYLSSGWDYEEGETESIATFAAKKLYEEVGIGPSDLDCVELHDASAPSEIMYYEYLGLCEPGEGGSFVEQGHSALGGKVPVNTSGGLMRKGHPIGATGIAQIVELTEQLRGEAGGRQVKDAKVALAENGGGYIGSDAASMVMTLLTR